MDIRIHNNTKIVLPFEYFCMTCGTMNLSFCEFTECPMCHTTIVYKGAIGTLDKEKLLKDYNDRQQMDPRTN